MTPDPALFPAMFARLPLADLPLPPETVEGRMLAAPEGLAVFFTFHRDVTLPAHSHGAQWGTVLAGSVTLTVEGETRTYRPGESYFIPAGAVHAAEVPAGSKVLDVFEEADRYAPRR
jgi:Uncharacterized conserved protein, contains double-stranded beta-helix domain